MKKSDHISVTYMGIWCILNMHDCTLIKTNVCHSLINESIFSSCGTDKLIEKAIKLQWVTMELPGSHSKYGILNSSLINFFKYEFRISFLDLLMGCNNYPQIFTCTQSVKTLTLNNLHRNTYDKIIFNKNSIVKHRYNCS